LAAINSINWARILAQTVYYVWGYLRYLDTYAGTLTHTCISILNMNLCAASGVGGFGPLSSSKLPPVTFVVPTGNFGNALSGYYAKTMASSCLSCVLYIELRLSYNRVAIITL
jgi:threonine synthase